MLIDPGGRRGNGDLGSEYAVFRNVAELNERWLPRSRLLPHHAITAHATCRHVHVSHRGRNGARSIDTIANNGRRESCAGKPLFIEELDGDGLVRDPGDTEFGTAVVGDGGSDLQPRGTRNRNRVRVGRTPLNRRHLAHPCGCYLTAGSYASEGNTLRAAVASITRRARNPRERAARLKDVCYLCSQLLG